MTSARFYRLGKLSATAISVNRKRSLEYHSMYVVYFGAQSDVHGI